MTGRGRAASRAGSAAIVGVLLMLGACSSGRGGSSAVGDYRHPSEGLVSLSDDGTGYVDQSTASVQLDPSTLQWTEADDAVTITFQNGKSTVATMRSGDLVFLPDTWSCCDETEAVFRLCTDCRDSPGQADTKEEDTIGESTEASHRLHVSGDPSDIVSFDNPAVQLVDPSTVSQYLLPGMSGPGVDCFEQRTGAAFDEILAADAGFAADTVLACINGEGIGMLLSMYGFGMDGSDAFDGIQECAAAAMEELGPDVQLASIKSVLTGRLDLEGPVVSSGLARDALEANTTCVDTTSGTSTGFGTARIVGDVVVTFDSPTVSSDGSMKWLDVYLTAENRSFASQRVDSFLACGRNANTGKYLTAVATPEPRFPIELAVEDFGMDGESTLEGWMSLTVPLTSSGENIDSCANGIRLVVQTGLTGFDNDSIELDRSIVEQLAP